jgi:hypothetical protein
VKEPVYQLKSPQKTLSPMFIRFYDFALNFEITSKPLAEKSVVYLTTKFRSGNLMNSKKTTMNMESKIYLGRAAQKKQRIKPVFL